ncbi:MAG: hypothetical protein QOF01_5422 [Thermomicrobiales bacterium]|jgi:hypothetical protein|nr:hypothetical protein [Thermomicrobiales bacterium]MEA2598953.1 hypothetical protein [Thermomicrobiales bacterium]
MACSICTEAGATRGYTRHTGNGQANVSGLAGKRIRSSEERLLSTIMLVHDRMATTVLLFMAAVGLWGLWSFFRGEALSGSLSGALVIGQVLIVAQGLFGAILYLDGFRPATSVHLLYGITAAIVLPFVWSYVKDRHPRQALLFYSLVALFIAGLATRGMTTGS